MMTVSRPDGLRGQPAADAYLNPIGGNWQHVAGRFRDFIASLEPNADDRTEAVEFASSVNALLRRRFPMRPRGQGADDPGFPIIAGGYAKDTAVRGISGVDILFVLPDRYRTDAAAGSERGGNVWGPILRDMTGLLAARFAAVEMSRDGWLSVAMRTADHRRFGVRIIPAFSCGDNGYLIAANAAEAPGRPWRHIVPAAEMARLDRADEETGHKARQLIRMLKVWRYAASIPVTPFAMELLACNYLSVWIYSQRSELFYDWMIRDFFFWMTAQAGRTMAIPGSGETVRLGDTWLDRANAAKQIAAEAADLERDNDAVAALACWRRIFGCRFNAAADDPIAGQLPDLAAHGG